MERKEMIAHIDRLARFLLLVYVAECVLGGSGRWLEVGPLSIRMVLFALCFAATLPAVLRQFKKLCGKTQLWVTAGFGVWLLICAVVGYSAGNRPGFIWGDMTGYMSLALLPGFVAVMSGKKGVLLSVKTLFGAALGLALVTTVIHFVLGAGADVPVNGINRYLNRHSLGGLSVLNSGIYRVYIRSQIFLQVALISGVWLAGREQGVKKWLLYIAEGILMFAMLLSYTRGFWLGFAVSAVILLVMQPGHWKQYLKTVSATLCVVLVLMGASCVVYRGAYVPVEIVNRFGTNLQVRHWSGNLWGMDPDGNWNADGDGLIAPEEEEKLSATDIVDRAAVEVRAKTLVEARRRIAQKPVFGSGLGTNLDGIRNDGKLEYMYIDVMMKTGAVGLLLFLLTFFGYAFVRLGRDWKRKQLFRKAEWGSQTVLCHCLIAGLLGVGVTSYLNPFLSNPMGAALVMVVYIACEGCENTLAHKEEESA